MIDIFLFGLTLIILFLFVRRKPKNFPPGPPNLPLIGSIPFLKKDLRKTITKLRKKYGPVFGFGIGPDNWIVICDFELYKDAMNREEFQNRPVIEPMSDFIFRDEHNEVRGVMFSNGAEWQEQRRFTLRHLRDFGFAKTSMEHLIHEEIVKCIKMIQSDIKSNQGQPISLVLRLNVAILNALWHIVTSQKLEYDDPVLKEVINKINVMLTATQRGGPMFAFPWLKYIVPDQIGYTNVKHVFEDVYKLIKASFDEHKESFQEDQLRDYMDVYIKEMNSADKDPKSSFHGKKGMENLYVGLVNLFIGGSETTSNTLNWALYHLAKNPDIQKRVVAEIQAVVGQDRLPSLEDRPRTPLTEAVVLETHRMTGLAFSGIPRVASKDTNLGEYFIPKGTRVMAGIYEILHEESYWIDPHVFRPDRFLDGSSGKVKGNERLVPFGSGKRICIGSTLAQNELYLFLSAFLQTFKFSNPAPDNIEPVAGFVLGCPEFKMNIEERTGFA